jgi:hypothetical protein
MQAGPLECRTERPSAESGVGRQRACPAEQRCSRRATRAPQRLSRIDPPRPVIADHGAGSSQVAAVERWLQSDWARSLSTAPPHMSGFPLDPPATYDEGDTSEAGRGDWRCPSSTAKPRPDERFTRILTSAASRFPVLRRVLNQPQPALAPQLVLARARGRCASLVRSRAPGLCAIAGPMGARGMPASTTAARRRPPAPAVARPNCRGRGAPPPAKRAADAGCADELGHPQRGRRGGCVARRRQPPRRTGAVRRRSVGRRYAGSSPERRGRARRACR